MNNVRKLSLSITLPVALFIVIICLQASAFIFQYQQNQSQLFDEKKQYIKGIAGALQTNLSYSLMRLERAQAQNIILDAAIDYNLMHVAVIDLNQQIVLSNKRRDNYMFAKLQLPLYDSNLLKQVVEKNNFIYKYNQKSKDLLVYVPLQMLSKENALNRKFNGVIYIRYSLDTAITALRYDTLFSLFKISVTLLICFIIFVYAIKRYFVRPLKTLAQVMSAPNLNPYSQSLHQGLGEIGGLQQAFIHYRKQTNSRLNELAERELRLLHAINGARDSIWDWNIEKDNIYFSERWKEMLGYKHEEFDSSIEAWESLIHEDDLLKTSKALQLHFTGKNSFFETRYRARCHNGDYCWILSRGQTVSWGKEGEPLRIVGTHSQIDRY